MDWNVSTAPVIEPITLAEAKLHLRVDDTADDDLIKSLIKVAREFCEDYQGRAYIERSITAKINDFPSGNLILPRPPLISVTLVTYYDVNNTEQPLSTDIYGSNTTAQPGFIYLKTLQSWPTLYDMPDPITIIYKAGYGDEASEVPETIKAAIKLLLGHLYENRQDATPVKQETIPFGVYALLSMNKVSIWSSAN